MLTIEDVSAVPLFSALAAADRERLARTSADMRLAPGEFAVHEGGEPALFAVLSGKIEVIKTVDGIERTLGWRVPGALFGEVPIALGTPFPGGYRAAEPSRVMRVELPEYYTIAAASKEVSQKVSALARERIGGLQTLAAEPSVRAGIRRLPICAGSWRATRVRSIGFRPTRRKSRGFSRRRACRMATGPRCGSRTER
jgi:thioredoxin reductase (NADPH)